MSSTELRQRRSERGESEKEKDERAERVVNEMMTKLKKQPLPGLTNVAQAAKTALAADPYNLQLILECGKAYATDEQWLQCANVLIRGWKRASELDEWGCYQLLGVLCGASLHLKKYKQALAVLNDMTDKPAEAQKDNMFEVMKCRVYSYNGDQQKALKAFHTAVEGEDFDGASSVWVACCGALKKVGLLEVTKSAVENLAQNAEERAKLDAFQNIAEVKEQIMDPEPAAKSHQIVLLGLLMVLLFFFGYMLYRMESNSLSALTGGAHSKKSR